MIVRWTVDSGVLTLVGDFATARQFEATVKRGSVIVTRLVTQPRKFETQPEAVKQKKEGSYSTKQFVAWLSRLVTDASAITDKLLSGEHASGVADAVIPVKRVEQQPSTKKHRQPLWLSADELQWLLAVVREHGDPKRLGHSIDAAHRAAMDMGDKLKESVARCVGDFVSDPPPKDWGENKKPSTQKQEKRIKRRKLEELIRALS